MAGDDKDVRPVPPEGGVSSPPADRATERGELVERAATGALERADEPPVVARFVVEIRSDGSRSVVRGRLEDHTDPEVAGGQVVEIEARAGSPAGLVLTLWRALTHVVEGPRKLGDVVRGLLPGKRRPR